MKKVIKQHRAPPLAMRNPVARTPLMGKGQVHQKSTKAKRRGQRVDFKKTWFERDAVVATSGQSHAFKTAQSLNLLPSD